MVTSFNINMKNHTQFRPIWQQRMKNANPFRFYEKGTLRIRFIRQDAKVSDPKKWTIKFVCD